MSIEELTAKIDRPCERKTMQFILIGKLDNMRNKWKKLKNKSTFGFLFYKNLKNLNSDFLGFLGFLKKPKKT